MKSCFKCGEAKPLSDFYRHSAMADGHLNKCKECAKRDVSQHRHGAGRARVLSYDRERAKSPERAERMAKTVRAWAAAFPERRRAQVEVGNAIRDGRLSPWPACCIDGCEASPEAHHPDYSAPLAVSWLCPAHHKQAHALGRRIDREKNP